MDYQIIIDYSIGLCGYTKQYVRNALSEFKDKHVDVKITSLGGDLDHALDIRQQFVDHGDITAYLSGFVASSATVIAMGAKRIVMSKYAFFLVHKCSNFIDAWGSYNADEMQSLIDDLTANKKENDKIDVVLANLYAKRCKKPISEILGILKDARWLTASEALELGFVDEVVDDPLIEPEGKEAEVIVARFAAIGLPTIGLENAIKNQEPPKNLLNRIVDSVFKPKNAEQKQKKESKTMEKLNLKTISSLLKRDEFTPDENGCVTTTANDLVTLNNHIETLESSLNDKSQEVSELSSKIDDLNAQIDAMKKAPGDTTNEIEDDAGDTSFSVTDLYNSVKDCY
ncbi:ATP-dependent Clp protease proteolytic subunit [Muribaculaceae bacterium]|nr:ATP-dependent Clp protease proteolytic subunit [Muribaculaceae bacterium]